MKSEVKFVYLELSPLEKGGPGIRQETYTRPGGRGERKLRYFFIMMGMYKIISVVLDSGFCFTIFVQMQ